MGLLDTFKEGFKKGAEEYEAKQAQKEQERLAQQKQEAALREKANSIVVTTGDITNVPYTIIKPVEFTLTYVGDSTKDANKVFNEATSFFSENALVGFQKEAAVLGADAIVFAKSEITSSMACGSKTFTDTGIISGEKWGIQYDVIERYICHWCGTAVKFKE